MLKIIIEGVNASGKSTLSLALQEQFNLGNHHPGPRPVTNSDAIDNCKDQLNCGPIVLDRVTPISRLCYEDPETMITTHYIALMRYLSQMKKGCIFIHCVGTGEHVLKSYYTKSHIARITRDRVLIRDRYLKLFKRIKHFEYDFNQNSVEEVINYVRNIQNNKQYNR